MSDSGCPASAAAVAAGIADGMDPHSAPDGRVLNHAAAAPRTSHAALGRAPVSSPPVEPDPEPSTRTENWGLPLAVLVIGMFMSVLDTSIVNVAIPTMQSQFGASTDDIQWVSTAYTLCLGVFVPTSAWLGERLGLRRLYIYAIIGFTVFSVFCGVAGDLTTMICFRILQGIPGGVIPVTSLTILYRLVPPWKLGAAMGLYGFGIVIAPGLGPALGGYLVEYVDWRLIFFINVPIGIIGVTAAILVLPDIPATPGRRFDLLGFGCVATGTFSLLLAVSEGQTWGWTGYRVLILLVLAALSLALFVVIELEVDEPLLDVRVFTHWPFINSLILVCVLSMGFYAVLFYVPLFLQEGQDITPMNTGLTVLPQAMVMAAIMPFAGNIYDRFGARWPAVIGLTLNAAGTLLLTGINVDATRPELIVWTMLRAGGMGLAVMPIMTSGLSVLPASMTSAGSAFNTLIQRVTSALGLAAMTGLVTAQQAQLTAARSVLMPGAGPGLNPRETVMQQHGPSGLLPLWQHLQLIVQAQTYSDVFMISGIASAIGAFLAFFISSERSASDGPREAVEIG